MNEAEIIERFAVAVVLTDEIFAAENGIRVLGAVEAYIIALIVIELVAIIIVMRDFLRLFAVIDDFELRFFAELPLRFIL